MKFKKIFGGGSEIFGVSIIRDAVAIAITDMPVSKKILFFFIFQYWKIRRLRFFH